MGSLEAILKQLDEREIAKRIGIPHDEARMAYSLRKNTVNDYDEFVRIISDYYQFHFTKCVAKGGSLSASDAEGAAKEIIEEKYHRSKGSNIKGAYSDAHDGTNGGLRVMLDIIAEHLKAESAERYIRKVFDDQVKPVSWEDRVDIIRQFINRCGTDLSPAIDSAHPERYANDYTELIRSYVRALEQTSAMFRKL
jgi:hypothetical protein